MNRFECPAGSTVLQAVDRAARAVQAARAGQADRAARAVRAARAGQADQADQADQAGRTLDGGTYPAGRVESELLLGAVRASSRLALYLDHDRRLDRLESSRFSALVSRRMRGEPVQYLTGRAEFYGREFLVSPAVLIPRPETERLVDHVRPFLDGLRRGRTGTPFGHARSGKNGQAGRAGEARSDAPVRFADIGTGSGVLAVTLALECPSAQGLATDVSREALEVAQRNAGRLLRGRRRIAFARGSLLAPLDAPSIPPLDLIVSNPPYVASGEMDGLPEEIRAFEPRLALHGGEDGLACYRELIDQAPAYLKKGGMIALEIGAELSAPVIRLMADRRVYGNMKTVKDYNGLDRIVSAVHVG